MSYCCQYPGVAGGPEGGQPYGAGVWDGSDLLHVQQSPTA